MTLLLALLWVLAVAAAGFVVGWGMAGGRWPWARRR